MTALKPWQGWLVATAAIWIVAFAWPVHDTGSSVLVHPRERWSLPELPAQRDLMAQAHAVGSSPLWGAAATAAVAAAAAPSPPDNRWELAGIYTRDGDTRVVVRYLARREQLLLKAGDKLPSGEKIAEIGTDSIVVQSGPKRRRMPLYDISPEKP